MDAAAAPARALAPSPAALQRARAALRTADTLVLAASDSLAPLARLRPEDPEALLLELLTVLAQRAFALPLALASLSQRIRFDEQLWDAITARRPGPEGRTHLMYAASLGCRHRVRFLLARGARVDACQGCAGAQPGGDAEGLPRITALFCASARGPEDAWASEGVVEELLAHGADPANGLHIAVSTGSLGVVRQLVAAGAPVDLRGALCTSERAATPLSRAARIAGRCAPGEDADALAMVHLLLDLHASPSEALFCASACPNAAALQLLLQRGGDARLRVYDSTPLLSAVSCGAEAAVRALLAEAPDQVAAVDANGHTPLMLAAAHGHLGTVRALLEGGAPVNAQRGGGGDGSAAEGDTALHLAAGEGHSEVVAALVAAGAALEALSTTFRNTPLLEALLCWQEGAATALLDLGANPSAVAGSGNSCLMTVAMMQRVGAGGAGGAGGPGDGEEADAWLEDMAMGRRLCKALCEAGADVQAAREGTPHADGCTALMFASQLGRTGQVRTLLQAGAGVDAMRSDNGLTACFFAANHGRVGAVRELLAWGARTDIAMPAAQGGCTMLMVAAQFSSRVVQLLLGAGADRERVDGQGRKALHWALRCGQFESAMLLR